MIGLTVFLFLLIVGLVIAPRVQHRLIILLVLALSGVMLVPPFLTAYTVSERNNFRRFHLWPMHGILSIVQEDISSGRTNQALHKLDVVLSGWSDLDPKGTNNTVRMLLEKIERSAGTDEKSE